MLDPFKAPPSLLTMPSCNDPEQPIPYLHALLCCGLRFNMSMAVKVDLPRYLPTSRPFPRTRLAKKLPD